MDKLRQKREKECIEQYKKKLTIVNKKKRIGLIVAGSVLLGGTIGAGGYFTYKAITKLPDVVVDGYIIKFEGTELPGLKVKKGETVDLTTIKPSKAGYRFDWWYLDENLSQRCPNKMVINNDIKIYAKWILVSSEKGLEFILNADNQSFTVCCSNEEELYENIKKHDYKLTIDSTHKDPKTQVEMPVTCIGYYNAETENSYGFENCKQIKTISFGSNINQIAPKAFKGCIGLNNVDISNTKITSIGSEAFANCTSISSLKTFDGSTNSPLKEIGENAFTGNTSLTSINLSSSVLRLEKTAFKNCTSLQTIIFNDATSLQNIGESCFENCESLTTCNIPYSIGKINSNAFKYCPLTHLTISDDISSWNNGENELTTIEQIQSNLTQGNLIYKNAIKSDSYKLSFYIINKNGENNYNVSVADSSDRTSTSIIIPASFTRGDVTVHVTRIAEQGFKGSNITKIVAYPDSITTIGAEAFMNCRSLSSMPTAFSSSNLTAIGDNAFKSTALSEITLPNTLLSIGTNAFCYTNLETINIPTSVVELKYSKLEVTDPVSKEKYEATLAPFYGCHYLKSITVNGATDTSTYKDVEGVLFEKNSENTGYTLMRYPEIKEATNNTYIIPDNTIIIGAGAFYGNKNAKIINISNNVRMISDRAFTNNEGENIITTVNIDKDNSNLQYIGKFAFGESLISNINLNINSLTAIDDYAFNNCKNLNTITIGSSVKYIGATICRYSGTSYQFKATFTDTTSSWSIYNSQTLEKKISDFVPVESGETKKDANSYLRDENKFWIKNS